MKTELPVILLDKELDCMITYTIENDSIGQYEYWGAKLYDKRPDYVKVEEVKPIWIDEPRDYRDDVEQYIEDNQDNIFSDLEERIEGYYHD